MKKCLIILFIGLTFLFIIDGPSLVLALTDAEIDAELQRLEQQYARDLREADSQFPAPAPAPPPDATDVLPKPGDFQRAYDEGAAAARVDEAAAADRAARESGDSEAMQKARAELETAVSELDRIQKGQEGPPAPGPAATGGAEAVPPPPADGATGAPSEPSGDYKSGERFKVFDVFNVKDKQTAFKGTENVSPIASVLVRGADFMVKVAGVIGVLVFVVGSLLLITAQGREDQIQMGKDTLFYAIIGLVIVFFSYLISVTVQAIFFK